MPILWPEVQMALYLYVFLCAAPIKQWKWSPTVLITCLVGLQH
jgi:hypothetical protein